MKLDDLKLLAQGALAQDSRADAISSATVNSHGFIQLYEQPWVEDARWREPLLAQAVLALLQQEPLTCSDPECACCGQTDFAGAISSLK